jgi:hypothetical protein
VPVGLVPTLVTIEQHPDFVSFHGCSFSGRSQACVTSGSEETHGRPTFNLGSTVPST